MKRSRKVSCSSSSTRAPAPAGRAARAARQNSPSGSISELEKLEHLTEVDALDYASRARSLAIIRLRREQAVRRQTLTAQLLGLNREEVRIEGQLRELKVAIDRLEYQIEKTHYRAPASGRLVDVVELAAGDFVAEGLVRSSSSFFMRFAERAVIGDRRRVSDGHHITWASVAC